jgi:predicted ABC-type transport system involved in lysophospholipase L1 biosynthesis ATPase subunit
VNVPGRGGESRALLALDAVTRRHRVGREAVAVLDDVSLALFPGEVLAIRAPRRHGKTTLLRIAAGIEAPDAGVVRLGGADLGALSRAERTRRLRAVGFAPKAWRVARGKPAVDHVALPLLAEGWPLVTALAKAHEAIERVGAGGCAGSPTDGLAPGDMTRVALAQALVRDPSVLLVDEPGVMAEPEEREEILRLVLSIAAERPYLALVVTARDVAGVAGAGRVLTLAEGSLRGSGEPANAEVLAFPGRAKAHAAPVA